MPRWWPRRHATRRDRHQLRHRPRGDERAPPPPLAALADPHLRAPQRRPAVGGRRPHALRPHGRAVRRAPGALHRGVRRERRGRLLRHHARVHPPAGRGRPPRQPAPRSPRVRARRVVHLLAGVPGFRRRRRRGQHQPPPDRRAHQRQRLQEVPRGPARGRLGHLRGRWPRNRSRRGRPSSTSASTTSAATAPPTWTRSPSGSPPSPRSRWCSTPPSPRCSRPACSHIGGRAILNSANLEDGDGDGSRGDRVFKLAKEYGAAVICLLIDEEGQARDVEWKMRVAHRIHDLAVERYGLEPEDLIFDALTFPLSTGDDDLRARRHGHHRGHPPHQGRAARGQHDPRAVQRQLRAQAGGSPRAEQRVPARVRRGGTRLRHRPRLEDPAPQPHPGGAARRLPRPDLGPPRRHGRPVRRRRLLRPPAQAARRLLRRRRPPPPSSRTGPTGPSSSGSASASSTATATASPTTWTPPWPRAWPRS